MRFLALLSLAFYSCQTAVQLPRSIQEAHSFSDVHDSLFKSIPDVKLFRQMGPLSAIITKNLRFQISPRQEIITDFIKSQHAEKAPLLIFSHGNRSYKETHREQATYASTWGFHTLVLQLPNTKRWIENGQTIYELVKMIHNTPQILDENIDIHNIILIGHSFGGSAISIAAGMGAPVSGLIFLDPAVFNPQVISHLQNVEVPAILLGADPKVFYSKKRKQFFDNKRGHMLEVTFKGATHDDAQFPSRTALKSFGIDPFTSKDKQMDFTAAIIASAFSLANYGGVDYALHSMRASLETGEIINPKIKY